MFEFINTEVSQSTRASPARSALSQDALWDVGQQPLLEDALALAPFFFGLAVLDHLQKRSAAAPQPCALGGDVSRSSILAKTPL